MQAGRCDSGSRSDPADDAKVDLLLDGRRITYAYDLLAQPPKVRDEVIVHELVHLLVPNHGKLFKASMRAYLPGWGTENSEVGLSCRSAIVTEKSN